MCVPNDNLTNTEHLYIKFVKLTSCIPVTMSSNIMRKYKATRHAADIELKRYLVLDASLISASFFFLYPAFTTLYEFELPHSRGSEITHDTPQSVGLLWTSDQPVAEISI